MCVCLRAPRARACVRSCTSRLRREGGVLAPRGGDPRSHSGPWVGVLRPSITRAQQAGPDITVSRLGSQILSSSFPPEPSPPALAPEGSIHHGVGRGRGKDGGLDGGGGVARGGTGGTRSAIRHPKATSRQEGSGALLGLLFHVGEGMLPRPRWG